MLELTYCELSFVPLNVAVGGGSVFDSAAGHGAFLLGLDAAYVSWRFLAWTAAEARLALYETCEHEYCSIQGSFFVGTRPAIAMSLDLRRRHLLILGLGLGWGRIGKGFSDRDPKANGFVLSPSLRYTYRGAYGLEVQAFLPAYMGLGDRYPSAISLNLFGLPTLIIAGLAHR